MDKKYSRRGFITLSGLAGLIPSAISNPMTSATINKSAKTSKHTVVVPDLEKIKELIRRADPSIWLFTGDMDYLISAFQLCGSSSLIRLTGKVGITVITYFSHS